MQRALLASRQTWHLLVCTRNLGNSSPDPIMFNFHPLRVRATQNLLQLIQALHAHLVFLPKKLRRALSPGIEPHLLHDTFKT